MNKTLHSTIYILAILIFGGVASVGYGANQPAYEHPKEWSPFYNQCVRRFNNSEEMLQLEYILSLSDEANETIAELLDMPKKACSCMAREADKSFQGDNRLNTLQIRLLAFLFRHNMQYPDEGVATRFGYAVLPCVDAGF